MTKTFDQGKDEIARLCSYFATNHQAFLVPGVKEAHIRQSLIDPLFEALGWDVRNQAMAAPQYREVIPEDSLEIEGQQKAPDYTFRVGTLSKFYAEAKRCGININADPAPAYQLRRYGWSAKVALSILTDFEETGVYDCTQRPRLGDKASRSRIQYFRYDEYADRWREIWDVFSREAVWSGAFDQYAASKRKRGTSEVDAEFLKEIEGWRDALARNLALRNHELSPEELNAAVQATIDRIIFLRMAEDRGLEPYEQLLKLSESPDIYARFMRELCRRADEKYNSGLFHFQKETGVVEPPDRLTPNLAVDDKVFKPILQSLYFAYGSPYHFGVLPVEILGTVYERFLGKVIRLTAGHQAKIEEKPEVRKAGGVYYTPAYIVDYIVKQTVGKQIEGKSPTHLAGGKTKPPLRVLDMACGSGSFLLGAYKCLLDHCLKWYIEHNPARRKKAVYLDSQKNEWRLSIEEKKRILTTHIFGVDIDPQAVEVSKLSLLLKALEGESDASLSQQLLLFHDRALPNLAANIKCGNSLIGLDYFTGKLIPDPEEIKRINPFDWHQAFPEVMKAGGFDCVIGNPPWGAEFREVEKQYLVEHFSQAPSKTKDSYFYFVCRGLYILKDAGSLGFIVPNTWLLINYAKDFRKYILSYDLTEVIEHGDGVFSQATVESSTFILLKKPKLEGTCRAVRYRKGKLVVDHQLNKRIWLDDESSRIIVDMDSRIGNLLAKLRQSAEPFEQDCVIIWGIKPYQEGYGIPPQTRDMIEKRVYHSNKKYDKNWKPLLVGSDVNRYILNFSGNLFIHYGKWLMYSSNENLMLGPKILMRQTSDILRCCFDVDGYYCQNSVFIVHSSVLDLKYLLALLNSKLVGFVYKFSNPQVGKVFAEIKPSVIKKLPIRRMNIYNASEKTYHDAVVAKVEKMLALNQHLAVAKSESHKAIIQRQIDAADQEIDRLVYDLYGLTEEEIAIVESV